MFWTEYNDSFFSVSLYSVQNIAIHRIRFIFDSSNTLVYSLGPNVHTYACVCPCWFANVPHARDKRFVKVGQYRIRDGATIGIQLLLTRRVSYCLLAGLTIAEWMASA